jgi:hypothetical protein
MGLCAMPQLSFYIQRWCASNNITYINAARDDYQTRSSNIQYALSASTAGPWPWLICICGG